MNLQEPPPDTSTQTLVNKCLAASGIDPTDIQNLMPKGTFHPMNLQDKYKPIKDMYLQGSIKPITSLSTGEPMEA